MYHFASEMISCLSVDVEQTFEQWGRFALMVSLFYETYVSRTLIGDNTATPFRDKHGSGFLGLA